MVASLPSRLPACDPCGSDKHARNGKIIEGQTIVMCQDFRGCIARAKAAGVWKQGSNG